MKRILLSIAFLLLLSVTSNGQNLFSPAHLIFDEIEGSTVVLAASLDGDKYWDVLSCSYTTKQLFWYKNNGDGTFSDFHIIDEDIANILDFEAVDFDGDGDKDILAISESQDLVFWYANDGEGQFGTRTVISTEADSPRALTVADVDGDGDLDALSASHWDGKIAWYQNDGNGNFGEQQVIHTEAFSSSDVAAADLDGDGDIDVVGTSYNDGRVVWSENLGGGNFAEAILISTQFDSPRDISVDDFDLDGDTDILIYSYWDKTLVLFKNDGIGNFDNHTIISQGISRIHEIYTGDLDKDGDTDILFSASGSRIIAWFENDGSGQFGDFKIIQDEINSATGVFAADLDRDGDKDVLVSNANGIGLSWYENLLQPNQLSALAFHDQNENGLFDSAEKPLPNFEFILNPGDYETYSNVDGYTHFFTEYGTYDLTFEPNTLWELTSNQENYVIQYDVNESLPVHQFGFKPTQILSRTEPYLSSSPTRCNRESTYWLNYSNTGTTTTNGTVTLEIDELMTFVSSHPEPDLIEGGILVWNFSELYAGHENKIKLQFKTPGTNSIGEILESQATIQLFNDNEELIYSKTTDYNSEVRCSYDPNDKLTRSNLLGQSEFAYIEDTIHYTIRFQNTGNDTAFNIRIEDVLDKKLDWTTFHPITSSHDYRTSFNRETGLVNFHFDDILLPDSTTNQEGSNGFVIFGIASLPNIGDKTEVGNTAYIFFDFNPPIITNTAILTLIQQVETDIEVLDTRYNIAVYPNPFSDFTTIEINGLPNGNYELELTDIFGRKVSELKMESGKVVLQRGDLESGLYFFRILKSSSRNFGKENELVGSGKILVE